MSHAYSYDNFAITNILGLPGVSFATGGHLPRGMSFACNPECTLKHVFKRLQSNIWRAVLCWVSYSHSHTVF
jgi:hypothetical protein